TSVTIQGGLQAQIHNVQGLGDGSALFRDVAVLHVQAGRPQGQQGAVEEHDDELMGAGGHDTALDPHLGVRTRPPLTYRPAIHTCSLQWGTTQTSWITQPGNSSIQVPPCARPGAGAGSLTSCGPAARSSCRTAAPGNCWWSSCWPPCRPTWRTGCGSGPSGYRCWPPCGCNAHQIGRAS